MRTSDQSPNSGIESHSSWRLLAFDGLKRLELEGRGAVDEFVIEEWLHLEQLQVDEWWLRVGNTRIIIRVTEKQASQVEVEPNFYQIAGEDNDGNSPASQ